MVAAPADGTASFLDLAAVKMLQTKGEMLLAAEPRWGARFLLIRWIDLSLVLNSRDPNTLPPSRSLCQPIFAAAWNGATNLAKLPQQSFSAMERRH